MVDCLAMCYSSLCQAFAFRGGGNFLSWYKKRFVRVYIPAWIMTIGYMLLGAYVINSWQDVLTFFVWPTHWHFVASIILLYIPLFYVTKYIEMTPRNYWRLAGLLFAVQLILYVTLYDTSYYHIDKVREPMIEFLFFQSMLLGLHYRWKSENKQGSASPQIRIIKIIACIFLLAAYFTTKMLFVKMSSVANFQIINQVVLWMLLYVLFDIFMKLETRFHSIENTRTWSIIKFISDRTLEIYLVQYVILEYCKIGPFPINWLILTSVILLSAIILRWVSQLVINKIKI
jgi:hypothetical protein